MRVFDNKYGQSIIEIIIAMAIFALFASSMVHLILGSLALLSEGGNLSSASNLAQEAIEAVISIKNRSWNKLEYSKSGIVASGTEWVFSGEGTEEQIGIYSREITFDSVYRNTDGEIVTATTSGAYIDTQTKKMTVLISWTTANLISKSILRVYYLTNWQAKIWEQNSWNGGDGQSIWGDSDKYDLDDGYIEASSTGLRLSEIATSTYANVGYLISSGYNILATNTFSIVEWDEQIPAGCTDCLIKVQIKTAPDNSGSPGTWTNTWSGVEGDDGDEDDYYTLATGQVIHTDHNGDIWIKYKVILESDTSDTPILDEIRIKYN